MPIAFPYRPGIHAVRPKPLLIAAVMAGVFLLLMGVYQMKAHVSGVQLGMPLPISPLTLPLGSAVVNMKDSGRQADVMRSLEVQFNCPKSWPALCAHLNRNLSREGTIKLDSNYAPGSAGQTSSIYWNDKEAGLSVVLTRNQAGAPMGQPQGKSAQYTLVAMEARPGASPGSLGGLENRKKIFELDSGARIPE